MHMVFITVIFSILFSACSVKDDRLFQMKDGVERNSTLTYEEYKYELKYENKIAPNDRVLIRVYSKNSLNSQLMKPILSDSFELDTTLQEGDGLLVTQKGTVRLPIIQSVKIAGLTEDQAAAALAKEYRKFIKNPYVTVKITNQRIIVIGEVNKPGVVPIYNGTMNLIEVISRTGYFTSLAERTNIKVIRGDLRNPEIRTIDLTKLSAIQQTSLILRPNDIVYVQARQMDGFNKAFKEVSPFFSTITSILAPFVQWTTIQGDPIY